MIYCNLLDISHKRGVKIEGSGIEIMDELAAIFLELQRNDAEVIIDDALEQSMDSEWRTFYESNAQELQNPNRRNRA